MNEVVPDSTQLMGDRLGSDLTFETLIDAVAYEYLQFRTHSELSRRELVLEVLKWNRALREQIVWAERQRQFVMRREYPTTLWLMTGSAVGKSHIAKRLRLRFVGQYKLTAREMTWAELMDQKHQGSIISLAGPDLLIVDDIAVDTESDAAVGYHAGRLGTVWEARMKANKHTIFMGPHDPRLFSHPVRSEFFESRMSAWNSFNFLGQCHHFRNSWE